MWETQIIVSNWTGRAMTLFEHSPERFKLKCLERRVNHAVQDWRRGRRQDNPHSAGQTLWLKNHFDNVAYEARNCS